MRLSEAVRRDDALRTTRHRLRQTDNWSLIDDRQRRALQQLCDDVRLERRHQLRSDCGAPHQKSTESDISSQLCCTDKTAAGCTKNLAAISGISSSSLSTTSTTPSIHCGRVNELMTKADSVQQAPSSTLTEIVVPRCVCVTLHATSTSNSTSGVVSSAALCAATTTSTQHLCVVITSTSTVSAEQSCVTVSTTTAVHSISHVSSKLSSAVRGRVTFDDHPTDISTTIGAIDSVHNSKNHKHGDVTLPDSSFVMLASTSSTNHVTSANVDEDSMYGIIRNTSSNVELTPASCTVPRLLNNKKENIQKVSTCTSNAAGVGGIKDNVTSVTMLINGSSTVSSLSSHATSQPVGRTALSTHQHHALKQRSGKGTFVTSSTYSSTERAGKVPPPVPTRTSSVLTGSVMVARSAAMQRPTLWQVKENGHVHVKEPLRSTLPRALRATSVPPQSTFNKSLSHLSALKRDRISQAAITDDEAGDVTETEII